jgi:hypothetical protein
VHRIVDNIASSLEKKIFLLIYIPWRSPGVWPRLAQRYSLQNEIFFPLLYT